MTRSHDKRILAIRRLIYRASYYLEYLLAFAIIVAILLSMLALPYQLSLMMDEGSDSFMVFMRFVMNLIIGIEFLHVICRHNLDSVIEVLMLTVTRSIIIEHMPTWESLLGVISICLLFLIRKYLYIPKIDKDEDEMEAEQIMPMFRRKAGLQAEQQAENRQDVQPDLQK